MQIYLPVAEMSANILVLLALGGGVGLLSGIFGVGGGFLTTPLLILIGVPPGVAVATGANQLCASSTSAALTHWRRRAVDLRMGIVLTVGGAFGSAAGVALFSWLSSLGMIDLAVSLCYVVLLGSVGGMMLVESVGAILRTRRDGRAPSPRHAHGWMARLPLKMRFRQSRLYISVIPPFLIGFGVGVLSAIMGVGGGFLLVPAMIYMLGMPTSVVVGTSLFQIVIVTGLTTILHAVSTGTVDVSLAMILLFGGVVGAQYGARIGTRLKAEQLRAILALLVVAVGMKMGADLVIQPDEPYSLTEAR